MPKARLDVLLVERGLAESRAQAQRLVMAGEVRVDGQLVLKPATATAPEALLEVKSGPPFVSRGGEKLQAALASFCLDVTDWVCADVGASTGGFTDCLLQNGAARVYAIDVGHGILHWKLRQDPRVVVMERTNARYVTDLPEPIQLATIDASFISLKLLLPVAAHWLEAATVGGVVIPLIKPQFEAGRQEVARGDGVIRSAAIHQRVLETTLAFAQDLGFAVSNVIASPLLGPKGNREFLAHLTYPAAPNPAPAAALAPALAPALAELIAAALIETDADPKPTP
jgi:23S rRNA (cytidine1920-2'-O)/16S rRNA (cytidine1409-2'-O)-methyltransferase